MDGEEQSPQAAPHGRSPSAWWFVAILLAMLAALMISHLGMLWVQVIECDRYARLRIEEVDRYLQDPASAGKPVPQFLPRAEQCKELHSSFDDVANLYLATILALLSGAGFSAGTAYNATPSKKKDEQP